MKVISLGHACQVATQIKRFIGDQQSSFFDWVITDFRTVLHVLENIMQQDLISKENFTIRHIYYNRDSWTECIKVEHIKMKLVSVHDIKHDIPLDVGIDNLVNKYKRRLVRLHHLIQSDELVHFVCCIDHQFFDSYMITSDDILQFFLYINKINSNNKCILHIIIPPTYYNTTTIPIMHSNNVFIHHLESIYDVPINSDNNNYNWDQIFKKIVHSV